MNLPPQTIGLAAMAVAPAGAEAGRRLHQRYRAAIDYKGIGRPHPIGNTALAFLGLALILLGVITAGVIAIVTFA